MTTWLSAHYEWIVGIVLTAVAIFIAWLQLRKKEPSAANAVTQSPTLTQSPNFTFAPTIHVHQTEIALEEPRPKSVVDETKPAITYPRRHDVVKSPITVSGMHQNQTGNYWLVSNHGQNYWPKRRVDFRAGGLWSEQFHTGGGPTVNISLVRVSDSLQMRFQNWVRDANKTQNWSALVLPETTTTAELMMVDSIAVTIQQA